MLPVIALATLFCRSAFAQSTIRNPGDRPLYRIELEPHLLAGAFGPPGWGTGAGLGIGGRASFEVARDGFIPSINDSVSVGVGLDYLHYAGSSRFYPNVCRRFEPGPNATTVCVDVDQPGGPSHYLFVPVVMQWNFWLAKRWSVFGEPGVSLYWHRSGDAGVTPTLLAGGRFHITEDLTLTLRLGYPAFSLGVSFLF